VGNCVGTLIGMMAGAARGFNSVIAAFATAEQTVNFTSELLIHENVYKWIHCGVARDQNNRSNVGDVTIFMGRAEIIKCIDGQVWHPAQSVNHTHGQNHLCDALSDFHHALKVIQKLTAITLNK